MSATDLAGNPTSLSRTYNVHWPFTGFLRDPLKNAAPGKYVLADAGQTINIVFKLGGDRGLDILADDSPSTFGVSCAGYSAKTLVKKAKRGRRFATREALALGDNYDDLKYNAATKEYTIKWKTDEAWDGTCRMLSVALVDNSVHTAVVKFS